MVEIGSVATFEAVVANKEQAVKVLEEAAELYAAWQEWAALDHNEQGYMEDLQAAVMAMRAECADLIQAACNLMEGIGARDLNGAMQACRLRNELRGRVYSKGSTVPKHLRAARPVPTGEGGLYACGNCGAEVWADAESVTPFCSMCGGVTAL